MSYAVITGASGGIGQAIALNLAKRGYGLILIARSEEALKALALKAGELSGKPCYYLSTDLSKADAPAVVVNYCLKQTTDISILVNNAGYGLWGNFADLTLDEQMNMMQLNMSCMVKLCHLFLPTLKNQRRSYVLNIASTAAYQAVPQMSVYAGSKAFVLLFSRGLRYELKKTPVSVTVISPGPVTTGFMDRAGMKEDWLRKRSEKVAMSADEVAAISVESMLKGKAEVVPGFLNAVASKLTGIAPKSLTEKIAASLYEK